MDDTSCNFKHQEAEQPQDEQDHRDTPDHTDLLHVEMAEQPPHHSIGGESFYRLGSDSGHGCLLCLLTGFFLAIVVANFSAAVKRSGLPAGLHRALMDGTHRRTTGALLASRGGLNAGPLQQLDRLHQVVDRAGRDDEIAGKAMRLDVGLEAVFHVTARNVSSYMRQV